MLSSYVVILFYFYSTSILSSSSLLTLVSFSSIKLHLFSSSTSSFTPSSVSTGNFSSRHSSINFSKVSQLVSFLFSVIYMCNTPSFFILCCFYFSSSSSLFTHSSISDWVMSSVNYFITFSKVYQLVSFPFYLISLCIAVFFNSLIYFSSHHLDHMGILLLPFSWHPD